MPKLLFARPPEDDTEARQVRTLARSRHAPADWIRRARMIARSWEGLRTTAIAAELNCHPQTVRERIVRFNAEGIDGLGDHPGAGRKRRISEAERSVVIALVATDPSGKLVRRRDGELAAQAERESAHWTLDALTAAARERGITISRSQVRRILRTEGVRWRQTHSWATSADPEFAPKGRRSSPATPTHQQARRPSAWTSSVR
jgi:transposase